MKITFLGTNGWYATKDANTACVLIEAQKFYLILDAGDGIEKLGAHIRGDKPVYMFLSHFHFDHIIGFHTLNKWQTEDALRPVGGIKIFGQRGAKYLLQKVFTSPYMEKMENMVFPIEIIELDEGRYEEGEKGVPCAVTCGFLEHKDPVYGYRFEIDGKVIAYLTDTGPCENQLELAKGADVFISECAHTPGHSDPTWPHMNPETAAQAAVKSGAKQLILFHFDPNRYHTMEERENAEAVAQKIFPNTIAAKDGDVVELP